MSEGELGALEGYLVLPHSLMIISVIIINHTMIMIYNQVSEGELGALEGYQATNFISIFQKVKLALNLLVPVEIQPHHPHHNHHHHHNHSQPPGT